jgi:hypothetical protein
VVANKVLKNKLWQSNEFASRHFQELPSQLSYREQLEQEHPGKKSVFGRAPKKEKPRPALINSQVSTYLEPIPRLFNLPLQVGQSVFLLRRKMVFILKSAKLVSYVVNFYNDGVVTRYRRISSRSQSCDRDLQRQRCKKLQLHT